MTKLITLLAFAAAATVATAQPNTAAKNKPAPQPAAAPQQKNVRTFLDFKGLPRERLRKSVSAKFYKQLTISPVDAYVVARAPIYDRTSTKGKIVRSEGGNGAYDHVALALVQEMSFSGFDRTESRINVSHVDAHVLIYQIRDAVMAVGFWNVDDARYAGYQQVGAAAIGFYQNGSWTWMQPPKMQRR